MFSATTHQVVKSLGKDTLTPVRSLDRADNIAPFSIVIKERRRRLIFWKRTQCLTTEFNLGNILSVPRTDDEKAKLFKSVKSQTIATFNYDTNFSLDGKLGVDLHKELLDVELSGSDSVTVKSDLGELQKEEVDLPAFVDTTKNWRIDLKHPLVAPLLNDDSKTLCLVTGVVHLTKEANISAKVNLKGSEEITAIESVVKEDGTVSETKNKTLVVPAQTPLAYTVYELQIGKDEGQFSLILDPSRRGGFVASLSVYLDELEGPSDAMGATALFQGIQMMSEEDRESLRLCTQRIVQVAKCLDPLNDLLHKAADLLEMNVEKTSTLQSLRNRIPCLDQSVLKFLFLAGFQQQEDETIAYPASSTEVFESCELLISLLNELDDGELSAMADLLLDAHASQAVISVLRPVWEKNEGEVPVEGDQSWLSSDQGKKLLCGFGWAVKDGTLSVPADNLLDTQALYLVIDAFMASV